MAASSLVRDLPQSPFLFPTCGSISYVPVVPFLLFEEARPRVMIIRVDVRLTRVSVPTIG
jgi:hypothetical protein